jgi:hypothetical protein
MFAVNLYTVISDKIKNFQFLFYEERRRIAKNWLILEILAFVV